MYPSCIPDLSSESALTICGRYHGNFPNTLKARGILGDLSSFAADLKIEWVKDIPLDRVGCVIMIVILLLIMNILHYRSTNICDNLRSLIIFLSLYDITLYLSQNFTSLDKIVSILFGHHFIST